MAFDILNLEESTITTDLAGKILGIYGSNNVGKSYVAARLFPSKTLWLATEAGYHAQGKLKPIDIESWNDFRSAVSQLTTRNKAKRDKVREAYKCVVVDVADRLPNLCTAYIINQYNEQGANRDNFEQITELSGIPYGGGYAMLNKELDAQINKLALAGFCLVLIFHDEVRKINANKPNEYEYIVPKNTFNKAGNALKDIPDFMIYVESQGVDDNGQPILSIGHCVQHKEFFARSRFTECPETINPFTAENLKNTVKIACEKEAELQGATTITYEEEEAKRNEIKADKKLSINELKNMLQPVMKALVDAKYKTIVASVMSQYLGNDENGKPIKISNVNDESQLGSLQCVYDKLVDFAEEKEVNWE